MKKKNTPNHPKKYPNSHEETASRSMDVNSITDFFFNVLLIKAQKEMRSMLLEPKGKGIFVI